MGVSALSNPTRRRGWLEARGETRPKGRFDENRVARAIHNLARNAVEAMADRGGRLTIKAFAETEELVIVVRDTGPGIPPEVEGRLFQSFVTAGKKSGTGLGLAIVKKIAEEHGGNVSVQSSSTGAEFEFRIPLDDGGSKKTSKPPRGSKDTPPGGGTPKPIRPQVKTE